MIAMSSSKTKTPQQGSQYHTCAECGLALLSCLIRVSGDYQAAFRKVSVECGSRGRRKDCSKYSGPYRTMGRTCSLISRESMNRTASFKKLCRNYL